MKRMLASGLVGLALGPALASAEVEFREETIEVEVGGPTTTVLGAIQGDQVVDYRLQARASQSLSVNFEPSNASAYFNVLRPDSDTALFIGSTSGNRFEGELPTNGIYTIRVYLMRNAARRDETANYSLEVAIAAGQTNDAPGPAAAPASSAFDQTLELQGIRFHVTCANEGSLNTLRIVPAGLEIDNTPIERTIDGTVTGAEAADLDVDGSPEIYVYATSGGSGSYGSLVAYSANRRKSLSEIYLPPVTENAAAKGYMGHDEFAVVENTLVRRFPVYSDTDTNASPTGGMRQIQYDLVPGEAGWSLRVERVVEY